ncbi:enoyl-CoA hydratase [Mycolicibacterium vaccae]|uniref:enoyl-CoA hydratase n=1 Tax=Mycolicibacterium vaccae TaxID=1810 RepID=UPI003CFC01D5
MSEFVSVVPASGDLPAGLATLLLSRPPTNALTRQVYREITEAVAELETRDDIAAVVVFGGHEIFSAGDDMPELQTFNAEETAVAADVRTRAFEALTALSKPTVAAITGYALGAGLTLALAADWRVSGDNVRFGATEILAGRTPADTGSRRLAETIGRSKAKDLVFSGRFVDAREALTLGLVDELVAPDTVYDAAVAWAGRLLEYPQPVLAAAKAAFLTDDVLADGHPRAGR